MTYVNPAQIAADLQVGDAAYVATHGGSWHVPSYYALKVTRRSPTGYLRLEAKNVDKAYYEVTPKGVVTYVGQYGTRSKNFTMVTAESYAYARKAKQLSIRKAQVARYAQTLADRMQYMDEATLDRVAAALGSLGA